MKATYEINPAQLLFVLFHMGMLQDGFIELVEHYDHKIRWY
jgi:hypothetical protein